MPIRELAPEVVAHIAAGEVVTRPGDVVKELVENAIDAILSRQEGGATSSRVGVDGSIAVEIWGGGQGRIRVADDGCGIAREDLPLAVRRYATSKILLTEDLERLGSLGFRGEALAAISAVGDLTILSSVREQSVGGGLEVRDGIASPVGPQARQPGTTVTVEQMFERVPARRKYQRASSAESAYISRLVQAFALAYPEIAFHLSAEGREVLRTDGSGDLRATAASLLGPEVERDLLVLRDDRGLDESSAGLVGLAGLLGAPSLHRATRNNIFLSINRRPVESRSLVFAIEEAYETLVPTGRHPVAIVDITVPPGEVDANVHPSKREVRLLRDRLAFGIVERAVRGTLEATTGIPRYGEARDQRPTSEVSGEDIPLFPREGHQQEEAEEVRPRLGGLRILGQVGLTYIICEGAAGLYLVDQHAAHERVLLERLQRGLSGPGRRQFVLEPEAIGVPAAMRGAAEQYVEALGGLGFEADLLGDGEVVVRAVPAALPPRGIGRALQETLETMDAEGPGRDWRDRLAVLLSCKTAIKAGQHMEIQEMQALLNQLDEATLCATCSHGRPTAILLSHAQLEREFGRR